MKIGLFIKSEVVSKESEQELINKIISSGYSFDNENPEVVFTVGGDGTFLKAVQKYLNSLDKITFVCLNRGKLAYFSDFQVEDMDEILAGFKSGKFKVMNLRLLKAKMNDFSIYAVNEIRIENPFHTLMSEVYINGEYLETFRGNGLVVSTSAGSSAYNKSLSGALMDISLELLELNEIAPINNRLYKSIRSPLILPKESVITFKGDFSNVIIGYDHLVKKDYNSNEISFSLSDKVAKVLLRKDHSYVSRINDAFIGK